MIFEKHILDEYFKLSQLINQNIKFENMVGNHWLKLLIIWETLKMTTLDEIAQRAGVSKSTVSNVLNNRDERVSAQTKVRVEQVIDELGYRFHRTKKGHTFSRLNIINVLYPHSLRRFLGFPLYQKILEGIAFAAQQLNYQIIIATSGQDFHPTTIYDEMLNTDLGDGYLILELLKRDSRLKRFTQGIKPFVTIGKPEIQDTRGVSWVSIDVTAMVEKAVRKLINDGHQHIAFLGLEDKRIITLQAQRGFERALDKEKITKRDMTILHLEPDQYRTESVVKNFLKKSSDITAFFTESQILAEGVIRAAKKLGRSIPGDLSIMSMLENQASNFVEPSLSGIDWKAKDLGEQAVMLLVKIIEGRENGNSGRTITSELIIRESCGIKI